MLKGNFSLKLTVFYIVGLFAASSATAQSINDSQALVDFLNRPKLSPSDAATWATALPKLVGTYITMSNGKMKLMGKGAGTTTNPTQTDLKNRELYRALISSQQQVGSSIVSFFNLSRDKQFIDELIVTDLISVTDPDFGLDKCLNNKPAIFNSSTRYWCISAITLSSVQQRKFQKVNKIASGNYGIVTADGNYSAQMDKQSMQLSASVSVIGPILNGNLVDADPSPTLVKETVGVNPTLPSPPAAPTSDAGSTNQSIWSKIFGAVPKATSSAPPAPSAMASMPAKPTGLEGARISIESM